MNPDDVKFNTNSYNYKPTRNQLERKRAKQELKAKRKAFRESVNFENWLQKIEAVEKDASK